MENTSTSIFELKSTWSRLIHRIHTLGVTQQLYRNSLAGLSEHGVYPKQLSSHSEDSSQSLDGAHHWKMKNWSRGWVIQNYELKKASFVFCSSNNELFHKIDITEHSHWDCLECLLKMFVMREVMSTKDLPFSLKKKQSISNGAQVGSVARLIHQAMEKNKRVKCTIPIGGGLITRNNKIENLVCQHDAICLQSVAGKLLINTREVKHVEVSHRLQGFISVFYNRSGIPQLIIEAA